MYRISVIQKYDCYPKKKEIVSKGPLTTEINDTRYHDKPLVFLYAFVGLWQKIPQQKSRLMNFETACSMDILK